MSLNPNRPMPLPGWSPLSAGTGAVPAQAQPLIAQFQTLRTDLERQVRRGDLTLRVAREKAAAAAAELRQALSAHAEQVERAPSPFRDRIGAALAKRQQERRNPGPEALQRESIRLMRQLLVEQQVQNRAREFEGQAFVRPIAGGPPAPTLDGLLAFHDRATESGDAAAREWARRQIEQQRGRGTTAAEQERIDRALDRPDRLDDRAVARHLATLRAQDDAEQAAFVARAVETDDASACVAALLLARAVSEAGPNRLAQTVLDALDRFPESSLRSLDDRLAQEHAAEVAAVRSQAQGLAARFEADARLAGLRGPDEATLRWQARVASRPLAEADQPVGLALSLRGRLPDDREAEVQAADPSGPADPPAAALG